MEPAYPDALVNMGNVLQRLHCVDEAIDVYRVALQRKPDHPHAYCNLGNALRAKGLAHEAAHCYITACKCDRRFPLYRCARAQSHASLVTLSHTHTRRHAQARPRLRSGLPESSRSLQGAEPAGPCADLL